MKQVFLPKIPSWNWTTGDNIIYLQRKQAANFTAAGQPRREEAVSALCWGAGGETQVSGRWSVPSWGGDLRCGSLALVAILPSSARRS